ncbi:MAG: hypothetical protein OJI67_02185, partial [Prosthecobacter sp.]|nr:hypothetical protein [Prosthecobacter sp.]
MVSHPEPPSPYWERRRLVGIVRPNKHTSTAKRPRRSRLRQQVGDSSLIPRGARTLLSATQNRG